MFLLDTGVLIARTPVLEADQTTDVAALSLAELEFGLSAAAARGDVDAVRKRSTRLASVRAAYGDGLPFDGASATAYGTVTAAILAHGRNPRARSVDLLIAAVAVSRGLILLTTQPEEFRGLEGVLEARAA